MESTRGADCRAWCSLWAGVAAILLMHWMVAFWVPTEAAQGG